MEKLILQLEQYKNSITNLILLEKIDKKQIENLSTLLLENKNQEYIKMAKIAKIYLINVDGFLKSVKAFSKKQICEKLNITMYGINSDCEVFSLKEWEEDIKDNHIDIDLTIKEVENV